MGLEGIVSKRLSAPYRSGPSRDWIKVKNPDSPAMIRARSCFVANSSVFHRATRWFVTSRLCLCRTVWVPNGQRASNDQTERRGAAGAR
jgi:ATP-dependent DNA ligase